MLHCKDCQRWYGAEDDEFGPCSIKHSRGDREYVTFGGHECDEPEMLRTLKDRKSEVPKTFNEKK